MMKKRIRRSHIQHQIPCATLLDLWLAPEEIDYCTSPFSFVPYAIEGEVKRRRAMRADDATG